MMLTLILIMWCLKRFSFPFLLKNYFYHIINLISFILQVKMHLLTILLIIIIETRAKIHELSFSEGSECSNFSLDGVEHNNIYITFNNVCLYRDFDYTKLFIITYCKKYDEDLYKYKSFTWSYSMAHINSSMPKSYILIEEDTHIISLYYPNIYHFMKIE